MGEMGTMEIPFLKLGTKFWYILALKIGWNEREKWQDIEAKGGVIGDMLPFMEYTSDVQKIGSLESSVPIEYSYQLGLLSTSYSI